MSSERWWGGRAEVSESDWQVAGLTPLHVTHSKQALGKFTVVLWKALAASTGIRGDTVTVQSSLSPLETVLLNYRMKTIQKWTPATWYIN